MAVYLSIYIIGHHHVKSSFGANNNSYEYYLGVFSCCQYLELYLRSKITLSLHKQIMYKFINHFLSIGIITVERMTA